MSEQRNIEIDREYEVRDGGDIIIKCDCCRKELIGLVICGPDAKMRSHITAECGHCGGKAFRKTITGILLAGPTDQSDITDMETISVTTSEDGFVEQVLHFKTKSKG